MGALHYRAEHSPTSPCARGVGETRRAVLRHVVGSFDFVFRCSLFVTLVGKRVVVKFSQNYVYGKNCCSCSLFFMLLPILISPTFIRALAHLLTYNAGWFFRLVAPAKQLKCRITRNLRTENKKQNQKQCRQSLSGNLETPS